MKVVYLIQTYRNPEQIYRLVQTIRRSSPESYILVSHNYAVCELDPALFQKLPKVTVLKLQGKGKRGDFSIVQGYLDAVRWLLTQGIEFDWLACLSGQDYPTQPLSQVERFLAETEYDGFLEYKDAFASASDLSRESSDRYLYQYWRSGWSSPLFESGRSVLGRILYRLSSIINRAQPLIQVCWSFDGLSIGVQASSPPFNQKFRCYSGEYFSTLSSQCVEFLYDFSERNPDLVSYYQKTNVPSESFLQTILVNSGQFKICDEHKRYVDFSNCRDGRPRVLTAEDYPEITQDNFHFARKFDAALDSQILDLLDGRIFQDSRQCHSL